MKSESGYQNTGFMNQPTEEKSAKQARNGQRYDLCTYNSLNRIIYLASLVPRPCPFTTLLSLPTGIRLCLNHSVEAIRQVP